MARQIFNQLQDASTVGISLLHEDAFLGGATWLGSSTEKWNVSCHISKQGCQSHQQLQPPQLGWWALREPSKGEKVPPDSHQIAATPHRQALRKFRNMKTQDTGDSWGAYKNEWFQWTQTLVPSQTQNSAEVLQLDISIFLINTNLLMFPTMCPLLQNSCITWPLLLLPQSTFSELSKCCFPSDSPHFNPSKT